jgi:hypothetical protein
MGIVVSIKKKKKIDKKKHNTRGAVS